MVEINRISNVWLENCLKHLPLWFVSNLKGNSRFIKSPCYSLFFLLGKTPYLKFRLWFVSLSTFMFSMLCKWAHDVRRGYSGYTPYFVDGTMRPTSPKIGKMYLNREIYKQFLLIVWKTEVMGIFPFSQWIGIFPVRARSFV